MSPLNLNSVSSHPTWLLSLGALSVNVAITYQSFKLEFGSHPALALSSWQPHPPLQACVYSLLLETILTSFYLMTLPRPHPPTTSASLLVLTSLGLPFLWSYNSPTSLAMLLLEGGFSNIHWTVNNIPTSPSSMQDAVRHASPWMIPARLFHSPHLDLLHDMQCAPQHP